MYDSGDACDITGGKRSAEVRLPVPVAVAFVNDMCAPLPPFSGSDTNSQLAAPLQVRYSCGESAKDLIVSIKVRCRTLPAWCGTRSERGAASQLSTLTCN